MTALAVRAPADQAPASAAIDLAVRGLSKRFATDARVLDDVTFAVARGEAVALLGRNGAGKSTLLRCCVRLIEPDAGTIRLLDQDVTGLTARGLRRLRARIGFVFQRHNLVPRLSALTNVLHGALARPDGGARALFHQSAPHALRAEAMDCLDRVGLADLALRRADRLSGGQSQRVAIARALMQRASILFADEPVASLDPAAGEDVMGLFAALVQRERLTLVFSSHDLRHALDYGGRIVALRAGRIALDAPSAGFNLASLREFYA